MEALKVGDVVSIRDDALFSIDQGWAGLHLAK